MQDTGKKLTLEQIEEVKKCMNRPVMYLSGGQPMFGGETPQQMVHRFALEQGLPEIPGYYGASLKDGTIYST